MVFAPLPAPKSRGADRSVMNIAVAAKGGVGKTIVAGTLARAVAAAGDDVLAIDHDADPNLAVSLGVPREADGPPLPADLVEQVDPPEGEVSWELTRSPSKVIDAYGIRAPDGVTLLKARTVEAESGDFVMGHVAISDILSEGGEDREDVAIVDMPAGLEYFGIIKHVDVMFVVVEHSSTALRTLRKMDLYARHELGMSDVRVIANNVRTDRDREAIEDYCMAHETDLDLAAVIPHDDAIRRAEVEGAAPVDYANDSPGISAIRELAADLRASRGQ